MFFKGPVISAVLQVHEEFKQNVENIGIDNLVQKFAEQKGTGKERPGTIFFTTMNVWCEINTQTHDISSLHDNRDMKIDAEYNFCKAQYNK